MSLTPKQQRFVEEYMLDLNATQAAIRAGYTWPTQAERFYVYFLEADGEVFYVGKGKGRRVTSHRRERMKVDAGNQVKAARVRTAVEQGVFAERIFASDLSEPDALRLERHLISQMRAAGLTNIASGSIHPLESQIARVDANLASFRSFDEWDWIAPDYARRFAADRFGSMRALYDWLIDRYLALRAEFELELKSIKGNQ